MMCIAQAVPALIQQLPLCLERKGKGDQENMRHRGAEGADNKTGDGAGIMLQIPHEFILLQGIPVPEKGRYGTGLLFLPKNEKDQAAIFSIIIEEIEKEGLTLMPIQVHGLSLHLLFSL